VSFWVCELARRRAALRTETPEEMTQRLKDFRTQELKKIIRFAGVNVIRLSKCSRESVEEQVRTALKQNLNIQNKNEKSKTQEARDPAGSRLQRSEGV
jgi:hypothetical protein